MNLSGLKLFACLLCFHTRTLWGFHEDFSSLTSPSPTISVVSLTQKGYLQFLKYVVDVPPLSEYTFCIWVKSDNFTNAQPLFSYSKYGDERLIRVWIAAQGHSINLEIDEIPVFAFQVRFRLHYWNHVCQSWSSYQGQWALFLNGRMAAHGFEPKLSGRGIEGGGDIVVGQEYTDFDRGYEDGVEGDVFGFNLILAAATTTALPDPDFPNSLHFARPDIAHHHFLRRKRSAFYGNPFFTRPLATIEDFNDEQDHKVALMADEMQEYQARRALSLRPTANLRVYDEADSKPLGLHLVEMGYNCVLGRGAPLMGERVLVSWTKTVVRVFGGATVKLEEPFCVVSR